jgi:hypothetical protein
LCWATSYCSAPAASKNIGRSGVVTAGPRQDWPGPKSLLTGYRGPVLGSQSAPAVRVAGSSVLFGATGLRNSVTGYLVLVPGTQILRIFVSW